MFFRFSLAFIGYFCKYVSIGYFELRQFVEITFKYFECLFSDYFVNSLSVHPPN